MMDMPMKDGMDKKEEKPMFKCPNCDCKLEVMYKKEDEMGMDKPMKKNTSNMPMGELRNKISTPPSGF